MAQAEKGKKRKQDTAQSTDRAGFLLLPIGLVLLAAGFMLALGITLQTSSYALTFFKQAAAGTGGMLTYAVPVFILWLGGLLCAASKRRVSMSFYIESLLLLLAVAAMMNLTLRVSDRPLMVYVGSNAHSLVEYLRESFQLSVNVLSLSGGAMGMLLAYPLYSLFGQVAGAIADGIIIIALLFALPQVNPARLLRVAKDTQARKPAQDKPTTPFAAATMQVATDQAMPAAQPTIADIAPVSTPPIRPAMPPPRTRVEEAPIPGFVPQSTGMLAEPAYVISKPALVLPPEPAASAAWPAISADAPDALPIAPSRPARRSDARQPDADALPHPAPRAEPTPRPAVPAPKQPAAQSQQQVPIAATAKTAKRPEPLPFTPGIDGMASAPLPPPFAPTPNDYEMPPVHLLTEPPKKPADETTREDTLRAHKLIETLRSFSIEAELQNIVHGPAVTRFAIRLAEGVNVNRLWSVMDNLQIELKARGKIRAEFPIPGTSFVGLEVSNDKPSTVFLREVLTSPEMTRDPSPTCVAIGRDITGVPVTCELMDMPHLLIAGATGSGKSVCLNSIICSLLYRSTPRQVRMLMVDPKFVELSPYNEVPHLLMPVVSDVKKVSLALNWVCNLVSDRYKILQKAGVRNLNAYNAKLGLDEEPLPRVVVIVDEMADLMTTPASRALIEEHIKRITATARAAGVSLVVATQRPSVNVVTGVIKANIPARIAFRVSSHIDSRTILDKQGAESLLGHGDMLFRSTARDPMRVQGCFVSDRDVEQTLSFISGRHKADYDPDLLEYTEKSEQPESAANGDVPDDGDFDTRLNEAIEIAVEAGQMSISMLQRVMRVGYARAGRLIDEMARRGIISGNEGTKPRKTLMTREQYYAELEGTGAKT